MGSEGKEGGGVVLVVGFVGGKEGVERCIDGVVSMGWGMVMGSVVVDGTVIWGTVLVRVVLDSIGCIGTVVIVVGIGSGNDEAVVAAVAIGSDTDAAVAAITLDGADCGGFGDGLGEWGVGV